GVERHGCGIPADVETRGGDGFGVPWAVLGRCLEQSRQLPRLQKLEVGAGQPLALFEALQVRKRRPLEQAFLQRIDDVAGEPGMRHRVSSATIAWPATLAGVRPSRPGAPRSR